MQVHIKYFKRLRGKNPLILVKLNYVLVIFTIITTDEVEHFKLVNLLRTVQEKHLI